MRIVVRNVPERKSKNVIDTMNGILKDGLKLAEVSVLSARRLSAQNNIKENRERNHKPAVIIATLRNKEDKQKVMDNKSKDSRKKYKGVFIHNDQSKEERLQRANFKKMITALKQLKGSRVFYGKDNNERYADHSDVHENTNATRAQIKPNLDRNDNQSSPIRRHESRGFRNRQNELMYENDTIFQVLAIIEGRW